MAMDITVPEVGESITEGILAEWSAKDGAWVEREEPLLVLETDKITLTVNAEESGRLKILVEEGETVQIGQKVGELDTEAKPEAAEKEAASDAEPEEEKAGKGEETGEEREEKAGATDQTEEPEKERPISPPAGKPQAEAKLETVKGLSPAVQRLVLEHHLDPSEIEGSGRDGRITKADVLRHIEERGSVKEEKAAPEKEEAKPRPPAAGESAPRRRTEAEDAGEAVPPTRRTVGAARERRQPAGPQVMERQTRQPMSALRQRIAERLVEVQQSSAILTTFNEVDMSRVMALRTAYKDAFKEQHGISLGFMSFFVKAAIDALQTVPEVNAWIDGDQVVRNHYYDIGVAVSTERGLVVPVVRDADQLSMGEIEVEIADYARRAKERTLELSEITGAVFTISNGGVFGSMMSTPILNPPGSAILGMHAIKKRAVVIDDEIVIRPMMYLAVSYDHRVIDGREAVTFLKRIVDCIESPERMLLEI